MRNEEQGMSNEEQGMRNKEQAARETIKRTGGVPKGFKIQNEESKEYEARNNASKGKGKPPRLQGGYQKVSKFKTKKEEAN